MLNVPNVSKILLSCNEWKLMREFEGLEERGDRVHIRTLETGEEQNGCTRIRRV